MSGEMAPESPPYIDFGDWLFWVTRDGEALLAVLTGLGGYFDESYREHADLFLVGGALFYPKRAKRFASRWHKLFPEPFHATKFNVPGLSENDQRKLDKAAELIAHDTEYVSCVSCSPKAAIEAFGHGESAQDKAYIACGGLAAFAMAQMLRDEERPDLISYIYDAGRKEGHHLLKTFFDRIALDDHMIKYYRSETIGTAPASRNVWLQAADYIAWEFGKQLVLKRDGLPPRSNFMTMVNLIRRKRKGRKSGGFYYHEAKAETLTRFSEWLYGLLIHVPLLPDSDEPKQDAQ